MKRNINEEDLERKFDAKKSTSREDMDNVLRNEGKIMNMLKNVDLAKFFEYVKLFFELLKAYLNREYREVPIGTIAAIVGALAYVLCPLDLIPDFIPGIGYIDDAGVLALCIKLVKTDLDKFQAYRNGSCLQAA